MKKVLLVFGIFASVLGCSVDTSDFPTLEVGQEFVNTNVRILVVDTFTVKLSTIKFDSINTSSSNRLLFGRYTDEFMGDVISQPYFELSSTNYNIPNDAEFDSISLILGYDGYFYNDTTLVSQLNVHELNERVRPEEDVFYNTSTLGFDTVPLVTRRFRPEPFDEDSLHITMPREFGEPIFDLIRENEIDDLTDLRDAFKGFTLRPDKSDNTSIIGFSRDREETYLRFYYSVPQEFEEESEFFDLSINPFSEDPSAFNHIVSQLSQSPLEELTDQEIELPSTASSDLSFIQSGTGYATKVSFPSIRNIFEIPGTGTALTATLELKPPRSSYNELQPLRDSLNIDVVDVNNVITETLVNGAGQVLGRIIGENEEFSDATYQLPVGIYIDRKLLEPRIVEDALVLYTPDYNSSINRVVLQGEENEDFEATLTLTYAIYEE
ncbi:MAG: DUF4270 family protein [Bacteroidota bacterium]